MNDWRAGLGARLRAARIGLGISQADLAKRAGISDRLISQIELGQLERPPRPSTIAKLALAAGVPVSDWLAVVGATMPQQEIDALQRTVSVIAKLEQLEPADHIKAEIRRMFESRLEGLIASIQELAARVQVLKEPDKIKEEVIQEISRSFGERIAVFVPPERIKADLQRQFESELAFRLSDLQPATKIKHDLIAYVDMRVAEIQNLLRDTSERLSRVADWQLDLMRRVPTVQGRPAPKKRKTKK